MENNQALETNPNIIELKVDDVMKESYLNYAMSVITSRALPDVRDGLKPVHRRILYSMSELGIRPGSQHKKSARVVGDVIGKYHPHGDSAVYDAAVRMAQDWSMRHALIDGQGNFGSMDGDSAAAMRYTEMRMTHFGASFFEGIDKEVVDFVPNYDGTEVEPSVLPVAVPNVWINGSQGIAVGMAVSIPPHNLGETVDALLAYINNPEIDIAEIAKVMPGPDFPTGAIVHDLDGYISALKTGYGHVKIRAKWHEEKIGRRSAIVIDELPYQTNKAKLVEHIADLVRERKIDGIADLRDESNKDGVRVVIELKSDVSAEVVFNQLISLTQLEKSYTYNVTLLDDGRPQQLGIHDIFDRFKAFRLDVIKRGAEYDLNKAQARLHILNGLLKALDLLDDTIKTIKDSGSHDEASKALQAFLGIDEVQAKAILEMRLHRLTGLAISDLRAEHADILIKIDDLNDIINREERRIEIMKADLVEAKEKFASPRRTEIAHGLSVVTREDLIEREDVLIPVTHGGYMKRIPLSAICAQNRGTRGRSWMSVGEEDFVAAVHMGSTHDYLLAVTDSGQVHAVKAFQIQEGGPGTKGRHFRNIFEGLQGNLMKILSAADFSDDVYLITLTARGLLKRTPLSSYRNAVRVNGVQGVKVNEGDRIVAVGLCRDNDHVMVIAETGKAIRFEITQGSLRPMGRVSAGNIAMRVPEGKDVIGMVVIPSDTIGTEKEPQLLCVGENGVGKRTALGEFPVQGRGGQGVICFNINRKTGPLVRAIGVTEDQDVVLFGHGGGANRIRAADIRKTGRAAAGVILMSNNGEVVDVVAVPAAPDEKPEEGEEG